MSKPIGKFDFLRVAHLWIIKLIDWNAMRSKAGRSEEGQRDHGPGYQGRLSALRVEQPVTSASIYCLVGLSSQFHFYSVFYLLSLCFVGRDFVRIV